MIYTDGSGKATEYNVFDFKNGGVVMGMYNTDSSIREFARTCMNYAYLRQLPLFFSSKSRVSKT